MTSSSPSCAAAASDPAGRVARRVEENSPGPGAEGGGQVRRIEAPFGRLERHVPGDSTHQLDRGGELVEARGEQDYLVTGVDARQQGDVESLGGAGGDGDLGVGVGGGAQGFGDAAAQPRVPHGVFVLVVPGAHGAGRLFDHVRRRLGVAGGTDRQVDGVEGQRQHEHLGQTAVRHSGRPLGDD